MRRVTKTSFTIAMAMVMIGLAVTQARADRVSYTDRCFGAGCVTGSVRIGELSLAFTESSLGVIDSAASSSALASFSPELGGISGVNFAGTTVRSQSFVSDASAAQRANSIRANTGSELLSAGAMSLSFSRLQVPAFGPVDFGSSVRMASNGSFSVSGVDMNANKVTRPYWANDAQPGGGSDIDAPPGGGPGGAPVPEPTTMLLLGTGLAGAAALVRKRLKVRGSRSK